MPSAVEVRPGAAAAARRVRATMAANSPGHQAPTFVIQGVPAMSLALTAAKGPVPSCRAPAGERAAADHHATDAGYGCPGPGLVRAGSASCRADPQQPRPPQRQGDRERQLSHAQYRYAGSRLTRIFTGRGGRYRFAGDQEDDDHLRQDSGDTSRCGAEHQARRARVGPFPGGRPHHQQQCHGSQHRPCDSRQEPDMQARVRRRLPARRPYALAAGSQWLRGPSRRRPARAQTPRGTRPARRRQLSASAGYARAMPDRARAGAANSMGLAWVLRLRCYAGALQRARTSPAWTRTATSSTGRS
jgi:hypothetical protein